MEAKKKQTRRITQRWKEKEMINKGWTMVGTSEGRDKEGEKRENQRTKTGCERKVGNLEKKRETKINNRKSPKTRGSGCLEKGND
ncbi:hypothetical protein NDU88_011141 [Pleurodeles waltl]|uniref:Uncharacterized protein n=1 Tax=Pleurodeles waltl TaxID=8319 RepID=A0AAV7PXU0_PLEWA|nr:hypothetical protein NDU88_011141 [Pleurodeles waltl]